MNKKQMKPSTPLVAVEEITSLTQRTFNEFTIDELEERLETDPFLLSSLFNLGLGDDNGAASTYGNCGCKKIDSCPELKCGTRNNLN